MKKILLVLFTVVVCNSVFSQQWSLFKNDFSHFTSPTPNLNMGYSLLTDASAYTLKIDTLINFSNRSVTIFEGDFSERFSSQVFNCFVHGSSVFGDSLVDYADSSVYFVNNERIVWKNTNQWVFYTTSNLHKLIISVDSVYALNGDSIKHYSFSSNNAAQFDPSLFTTTIKVSKSKGMLNGFDLSYFPSNIKPITYFHNNAITTADIYNLEVGDEYHYQSRRSLSQNFALITVDRFIKKVIGKQFHGQDSVTYEFERQVTDDELVVVNNNPFPTHQYTHFQDTIVETYSLIDTILTGRYLDGFALDTTFMLTTGNTGVFDDSYTIPSFVDFSGVGRTLDTLCDYTFESEKYSTYVFGIGMFHHFINSDPTQYSLNSEELVYYKKGLKTWGNPLSIPVGIAKTELSDISYHPNPIKNQFYIDNLNEDVEYKLISANGATIKLGVLTKGTNNLSLQFLKKGIYFLQLQTQEEFKTIKLLKE